MVKQFIAILKNDFKCVIKSNQYLILICSLLVYTLYINCIYINNNVNPYPIIILDSYKSSLISDTHVSYVDNEQQLYQELQNNKEAIAVKTANKKSEIVIIDSGSEKINNLKKLYVTSKLKSTNIKADFEVLGTISFKQHKRIEMTSVVIFFEITAISFLTIAALFFKEKEQGILKISSIMPIKKHYLILSKIIVFLLLDICFVVILCLLNIGYSYFMTVLINVLIQVLLLSPIMVMLGFIFSLLYRNFKQFIFAYTGIIILFTSPVFLFVNTPFKWSAIEYFPTYYLYTNLHKALYNKLNMSLVSYLVYILVLILLFIINTRLIRNEMKRS
ncbi:ABC transporter permease [Clostridium sp. 'deep sea']|uniref:ABC transporter permease n=1 Tax=Clostridium sp. 'deep sea' TaxID=2779445 RepID=UPI001896A0C9|nr:ABC transporter permease [Clostridium sp. 'deep sea']QOR34717.1 ABC transporter permease [Clostridium sp. 'deep sea']